MSMASIKGIKNTIKLLLSLILFCNLFMIAVCRPDPSIESENESEEAYDGSDGGPNSDSIHEDETPLNDEGPNPAVFEQQEQDTKEHAYLRRSATDFQLASEKFADSDHVNNDEFNSDIKENDSSMNEEEKFQALSKRRAKTYNDDVESSDAQGNNSGGRELYRVGHRKIKDSNQKNQEDAGNMYPNESEAQFNKRFEDSDAVNDPHNEHSRRSRMRKNSKYLQNRDRRQVQETTQKDINVSTLNGDSETINENDEIAIKNQIKELSNQELDELLNSLSEDKRHLLKKILEDNPEDPVIKREITKKAGAVEENNCMEGGQMDLSETGGVGLSITSSGPDPSDLSNTTENTPKMSTVSPKVDSKIQVYSSDLVDSKLEGNGDAEGAIKTDATLNTADDKTPIKEKDESKDKSDYKREANPNEFENAYAAEDSVCPDDLSEIPNEETELEGSHNSNKREAGLDDTEIAETMKSLEESFPNSKNYDEPSGDPSNMAPLVRVKRKNDELKKRSVNISPTAYSSDNEEASEFDDEGYNEHQSNLEKNFANKPNEEASFVADEKDLSQNAKLVPSQQGCSNENSNKENDKPISLGTDSDSVISGVEGVDENLMYNGVSRNKRNMDRYYKPEVDLNRFLQTTSIVDNNLQPTAENMQVGSYQENDAFGPLPKNYEGDLGRYKRVRQVKEQ